VTKLQNAVSQILAAQKKTEKTLAIILVGHKLRMWRRSLSDQLKIPLLTRTG